MWALAHPTAKGYINDKHEVGYQDCKLIITESNQPAKINFEDYPLWARNMILNSIKNGSLINKGDKIEKLEKTKISKHEKISKKQKVKEKATSKTRKKAKAKKQKEE